MFPLTMNIFNYICNYVCCRHYLSIKKILLTKIIVFYELIFNYFLFIYIWKYNIVLIQIIIKILNKNHLFFLKKKNKTNILYYF